MVPSPLRPGSRTCFGPAHKRFPAVISAELRHAHIMSRLSDTCLSEVNGWRPSSGLFGSGFLVRSSIKFWTRASALEEGLHCANVGLR